jgi:hypothetical protein
LRRRRRWGRGASGHQQAGEGGEGQSKHDLHSIKNDERFVLCERERW